MTGKMVNPWWTRDGGDVRGSWIHDGGRGRARDLGRRRRGRVALGPHDHSRFRRYPGTRPYLLHVVYEWPLPNYPDTPKI